MDKGVEELFARYCKKRFTIISESKHERQQVKNVLRDHCFSDISEQKDFESAWSKLELSSTNILVFSKSSEDGEDFLDQIVESARFKKTPLIIFTKKPADDTTMFASADILAEWVEEPVNGLKVEQALVKILQKGIMEKSLLGHEDIGLEMYGKGVQALEAGDLERARELFRQSLKGSPDFIEAYVKMVETLIEQGDFETALRVLNRALTTSPDHPALLRLMAALSVEMDDKETAIKTLDMVTQKLGADPGFVIEMGNLALDKNWNDEAIRYFEMAKDAAPDLIHVYNRLGIAQSHAKRPDMALKMYEKALSVDDQDAGIHFNIGMTHYRNGDKKTALEYFRKAEALDPAIEEFRTWIDKLKSAD